MAHNGAYLDGMQFGNDGTQVDVPFHDPEALHDEENAVKEEHITDGAVTESKLAESSVTEDKLADGCVTADKIDPELKESWDSQSPEFSIAGSATHCSLCITNAGRPWFAIDLDDGTQLQLAFATGNDKSIQLKHVVNGAEEIIARWT